jgi:hypothetical protein
MDQKQASRDQPRPAPGPLPSLLGASPDGR